MRASLQLLLSAPFFIFPTTERARKNTYHKYPQGGFHWMFRSRGLVVTDECYAAGGAGMLDAGSGNGNNGNCLLLALGDDETEQGS